MNKIKTIKLIKIIDFIFSWIFKISALILLPLIIYFIIYISLNKSMDEFFKIPEWMFIAIILYGDTLTKSISFFYRSDKELASSSTWEGAEKESLIMVYWAILGITTSSVLLMFIVIYENKNLDLPSIFYKIELIVFLLALITSLFIELLVRIVSKSEHGELSSMFRLFNDFVDEKFSEATEKANKSANEIIEHVVPKIVSNKAEFDKKIELIKNEFVNIYSGISSSEIEKRSYFNTGMEFERLVSECLNELKVPIKVFPFDHSTRPDFVAVNKDGKNIPIEVKFYTKRVVANELILKIFRQIKMYMDQMNSDESILIISSEVSSEALARFKEFAGKDKIHIVIGSTKEELKSQLGKIFT